MQQTPSREHVCGHQQDLDPSHLRSEVGVDLVVTRRGDQSFCFDFDGLFGELTSAQHRQITADYPLRDRLVQR